MTPSEPSSTEEPTRRLQDWEIAAHRFSAMSILAQELTPEDLDALAEEWAAMIGERPEIQELRELADIKRSNRAKRS